MLGGPPSPTKKPGLFKSSTTTGGSVLTEEQKNDFRTAFRRDLRERATAEAWVRMEEKLVAGVQDKECNLRGCHIGTHLCIALCQHYMKSGINTINLNDNLIMDLGAEAIGQLLREAPSLLVLDVGNNDISPAGLHSIAQAVETHKRMHTLIIGSDAPSRTVNRCDAPTAKLLFEKAVNCRTLRTLHLNHIDIGSGDGGQEALLAAVPLITGGGANVAALHAIHLGHTNVSTSTAIKLIDAVKVGGSLTTLDLQGNNLGPQAGEALGDTLLDKSKRATVSNLHTLLLQQNPSLDPSPIFAGLAKDRGVTILNVSHCSVNDSSLSALCQTLASNNVLTDIDVSFGHITEVGAVELARGLVRHPAIRRVVLSGNRIKDDGACAMAAVIEHGRNKDGKHGDGKDGEHGGNGTNNGKGKDGGGGGGGSDHNSNVGGKGGGGGGGGDSGGGGKGGDAAGSPSRGGTGAASVGGGAGGEGGSTASSTFGLEELHLDECWISDRGAVALGVAIASNTSLRTLRMNNNHISGSAGTALAALIEKNKTLLTCSVVGNTLSHSTASAIEKVVERNRAIKADEGPGRLRQEICRLHYQLYKLEEAKAELQQQQKLRDKHTKAVEALENQLRGEDMEFRKKTKELRDSQRDAEISCQTLEQTMKSMADNFDSFVEQNRADVASQEARLKQEQQERAKAEEELERVQREVQDSTKNRQIRVDALKQKLDEAKRDHRLWLEQTSLYREQLEAAQEQMRQLEAQGLLQNGGGSARSKRTGESGGDSSRRKPSGKSRRGRSQRRGSTVTRRRGGREEAAEPEPDAAAAFLEQIESARGDNN